MASVVFVTWVVESGFLEVAFGMDVKSGVGHKTGHGFQGSSSVV